MKIERLTLHGFKSFADRVELSFEHGVTGVIGPNGSGKSNVVEAIRFVMGSRARALRAREAEALIFHGGDGRKPMPFAEVELVLRNGRERYVVSRRIDRSGEQEVRLNGKRATFRQIERVLAGSGLGKNAQAIVGQGEVALILESSPDALLERLEEAAGLRVVTLALRETRQRLERAARHLDQLREQHAGRLAEKARLTAEAEEARRAEALARERLEVQRGLFEARRKALAEEIERLRARISALEEERQALNARAQEERELQEAAERERALAETRLYELKAAHAAKESEARLLGRELEHLQAALKRLEEERARLTAERAKLEGLEPPRKPEPPGTEDEEARLHEERDRFQRALEEAREKLAALRRAHEEQRRAYQAYREALARYEAERGAYESARSERERWERVLQESRAHIEQLEAQRTEKLARAEALREERRKLREQRDALRAEAEAARREAERLEALVAGGADLAEGPRKLAKWRLAGTLGVVADLLEVPQGLEAAAEAALGPRLQWVLVEDEAAVKTAVERLKREGGRATLLARELARPRTRELSSWLSEPGVVGAARELFAIRGERKLTDALFGDTLVVEDLETALALARKAQRVRMVTRAGEVIDTLGSVSGGRAPRGAGERLALRNRLKQLRTEQSRAEDQLAELEERLAAHERALEALQLDALEEAWRGREAERRAAERALEGLAHVGEPPRPPEAVEPPDDGALQAAERAVGEAQQGYERTLERLRVWDAFRRAQEAYRLELRHYEERQERLAELSGRLEQLEAEQAAARQKHEELARQLEEVRASMSALGLEEAQGQVEAQAQRLRELKQAERARVERLAKIAEELEAAKITRARREATLEEAAREAAELPPGPHAEGSLRKLQLRLREIERELEAIGPVNHRAAQALEQLESELGEVERVLVEAEEAARRLQDETAELRQVYDEQLGRAFQRFRERFAYYGRALLGGHADVRLDEEGLHLTVQPQGKRTRDLGLLSTGEKTMGALGFLFALAEVGEGSLPIAVLDEVDAPLDEANILRFVGFLRDFARERQFILITHQKRTMEACDVLWGVTSQGGASMVYGLKREEVES